MWMAKAVGVKLSSTDIDVAMNFIMGHSVN